MSLPPTATETYQFYNLPFCTPAQGKEYKTEGLGEVLEGDRLVTTPYDIQFKLDRENEVLCSRELGIKDLAKFRKAVKKDYYYQVFRGQFSNTICGVKYNSEPLRTVS